MPIRPPSLDDRSFDDLVSELLARIPAHTPEWTDPRPGDLIVIGVDSFTIQGEPVRDRERLIWSLDLRPS